MISLAAGVTVLIGGTCTIRMLPRPAPSWGLIASSTLYLAGACFLAWSKPSEASTAVLAITTVLFSCFLVGYALFAAVFGAMRNAAPALNQVFTPRTKWVWLVLVMLTTGAYIFLSGTDQIVLAFFQLLASGDTERSILELRLNYSTGEDGWMAPGYGKQLRDILLPMTVLLVVFCRPAPRLRVVVPLLSVTAVALLSSGQRGPLALLLLALVLAAAADGKRQQQRSPWVTLALIGGLLALPLIVLTEAFRAGRGDEAPAIYSLLDRAVTRLPEENALTAPLWIKGAAYPGEGWVVGLAGIVPGTQRSFSSEYHVYFGGGESGNSPLGLWADVFFNFGWLAGALMSTLLGYLVAAFDRWVDWHRMRTVEANLCATWIAICMLQVYSPYGFLLYGPFLLALLLPIFSGAVTVLRRAPLIASNESTR